MISNNGTRLLLSICLLLEHTMTKQPLHQNWHSRVKMLGRSRYEESLRKTQMI